MPRVLYPALFLTVILIAIALRAPFLDRRPMHTDEAVHAIKFGMLLEDGFYRYDRNEFHGPTLNYFTLVPARLESAARVTEIDETTLRVVPVVFGIGLIPLLLLLRHGLGRDVVVAAGFFTALSPAMVFYSRYYIQETLLVFFTFAALASGYRYLTSGRVGWAVATGVFLGLMHATKETAVIAAGSMLLALLFARLTRGQRSHSRHRSPGTVRFRHSLMMLAAAFAVSALFYSSFLANPSGITDSYSTYANYLDRVSQNERHIHPWYYYVGMLLYFKGDSGPVWTEALIVLLAGLGIVASTRQKPIPGVDLDLLGFISFYTATSLVIYSAIPYKTPWNMLGVLHGLIILAGVGLVAALNWASGKFVRVAAVLVLILAGVHLARQSYLANFQYYADPANPYVYAHPSEDVIRMARRVRDVADAHPDGTDMYVEVITPGHEYWPLPWYLRSFPNTGWWSEVNMDVPAAPVILASPSVESDLLTKLYELPPPGEKHLYVPLFESYTELRPAVEVRGYVVEELWSRYQQSQSPEPKAVK